VVLIKGKADGDRREKEVSQTSDLETGRTVAHLLGRKCGKESLRNCLYCSQGVPHLLFLNFVL
jgi:hypothetical protein